MGLEHRNCGPDRLHNARIGGTMLPQYLLDQRAERDRLVAEAMKPKKRKRKAKKKKAKAQK